MMHDRVCRLMAVAMLAAGLAFQLWRLAPTQVNEFVFGMGAAAVSVMAWPGER